MKLHKLSIEFIALCLSMLFIAFFGEIDRPLTNICTVFIAALFLMLFVRALPPNTPKKNEAT